MQHDTGIGKQLRERLRRRQVGEQAVDLVEACQLDHCRPIELAVIGGQPYLPRLRQNGLRHFHLAVIEITQTAVGLDRRDADQRDVDLELPDEIDRGFADDASIAATHHAAGNDHLAIGVVAENRRDIQVVGDDAQAACA